MKEKTDTQIKIYLRKHIRGVTNILKLSGDASARDYFRIFTSGNTFVAMVYPESSPEEIARIRAFSGIYKDAGLMVPEIIDQIGETILLQEDIGDISLQEYLRDATTSDVEKAKNNINLILVQLKEIPGLKTSFVMDQSKIEFEIDFFINYFVEKFFPFWNYRDELREEILKKLIHIDERRVFAHRDFHSRNIFFFNNKLYLIDFQDSLRAPEYYDTVSFVFDSYMDKKYSDFFLSLLEGKSGTEEEQIYLTAYQRNIKALGTFGYQNFMGNLKFFEYIEPTIKNIRKNIHFSEACHLSSLFSLFEKKYLF